VKKVIAAAGVLGLALTGVASATAASAASDPAAAAKSSIKWGSCAHLKYSGDAKYLVQSHAQCAYVSVPENYNKPHGTHIKIAVSLVKHTSSAKNYQGIALTNPGGPGGSGVTLPVDIAGNLPTSVAADYDWIGFDPRGVENSIPEIQCNPNYFGYDRPNYIPTTKKLEKYWLNRSKGYDKACATKVSHGLLSNMTTIDSANDMDSIRKAMGSKQINYYGFSYGTYLGQVYSTLYPTHVRRMILDSNVDPRGVWYKANLDQDIAFNANIKRFFAWIAQNNKVLGLGTTEKAVEKAWYGARTKLDTHPGKATDGKLIGPDEWTDAFNQAGYYRPTWGSLATGFSAWVLHHSQKALDAVEKNYQNAEIPGDDNEFAVYNAVQCTDVQWPTSWAKWKRDNTAVNKKSPFETWSNAWFNAPCLHWPAAAHTPVKVNGSKVKSALLIDEQYDAATPYEGTLYTRKLYPHASMVEGVGGTTHADSIADPCEVGYIAQYLATGKLPARKAGAGPDAKCAPIPIPPLTGSNSSVQQAPQRFANPPLLGRP
jgi:pimeloyl-ACP methyl ester carboxylesterase